MTLRTSRVLGAALIAGLMQIQAAAGDNYYAADNRIGDLEAQVVSHCRALEEGADDVGSSCSSSCCNTGCCYRKRC